MPIYEYRCEACSHEMEKLQKISDAVLLDCPECGQPALKRLVSAAAFRLKGNGWYETDFKKDNKRNLADGSGGKAEGKPAATSEAKKDKACSAGKPDAKPAASTTSNP